MTGYSLRALHDRPEHQTYGAAAWPSFGDHLAGQPRATHHDPGEANA